MDVAMCGNGEPVRNVGAGSKERRELGVVSQSSTDTPDAGERFVDERMAQSTGNYACGVSVR